MVAATSEEMVALSTTQVIIHPLVLLSVKDHAARVAKGGRKRVVGVLSGQDLVTSLNIANVYWTRSKENLPLPEMMCCLLPRLAELAGASVIREFLLHVPSIGVEHLLRNIRDISTGTLSIRVTD
ncbi:uncharacterized protein MELLADRAFT_110612 [Melampsora larici-populina 98AG31]|uniref:JAB1/MPN/MOV34 metalloenzyme domain-containing protein n=1 Tax=Melampsora larici-populina (strain 98AG31 / pathotype 3-4-7) TaxID=747676 RepID=F4S0D5_MELLP|nr:uncharacterized protein MELLADRAFT_110612 [Melampsora larici-populina 98AG31]EGG01945.1 hypothetical protein MELLADRAFT_110612 [Melampsora larici-populina 98AG31]